MTINNIYGNKGITVPRYEYGKDFIFKDGQIYLTIGCKLKIENTRKKKLTGSRIGAVFGNDEFRSPFQLWCEILGFFYKEEDERSTYFLRAGNVVEKTLREYAELKTGLKFKSYDPHQISYDLFPDNEIFGGIPDGEQIDDKGNVLSILEIKTAAMNKYYWVFEDNEYKLEWEDNEPIIKNEWGGLKKWFKDGELKIPARYEDQLSLYLYLRGITKGYFCVAFLKDEDYKNPQKTKFISEFNNYYDYCNFEILPDSNEHILIWKEFNLDLESFSLKIKKAKDWYLNHVEKCISPKMTSKDLKWFGYWYPEVIKRHKLQNKLKFDERYQTFPASYINNQNKKYTTSRTFNFETYLNYFNYLKNDLNIVEEKHNRKSKYFRNNITKVFILFYIGFLLLFFIFVFVIIVCTI